MYQPSDKELDVQAQWNLFLDGMSDEELKASFEGEDMYSVALGYMIGKGLDIDSAHLLLAQRGTRL